MSIEGVDYAWARPTVAGLVTAGKKFTCRYGGPGSAGKQLDKAEARALIAAGIAICANAEGAADGMLGGFTTGASWARSADTHFRACGMPATRPIYLSADVDVTATQWPKVADALRGAASVLGGVGRVGVYGSYDVMLWARRDGVAAWFWQTYAWSEGRWAPGNHIEQYRNGVALAGGNVDLDRALTADYGQWGPPDTGDDMLTSDDLKNIKSTVWYSDLDTGERSISAGSALLGVYDRPPVEPTPVDVAALAAALVADPAFTAALEAAAEKAVRTVAADAAE